MMALFNADNQFKGGSFIEWPKPDGFHIGDRQTMRVCSCFGQERKSLNAQYTDKRENQTDKSFSVS